MGADFKERLFEELEQLQDLINKLINFASSEKFRELDVEQQDLLKEQIHVMNQYENILSLRIQLIEK